ncbi:MAG: hypothetical protein Q9221_008460 [Calogaya cf. arnoldii]
MSSSADSAYDGAASLNESITVTIDSTYTCYRWENGRRYHSYHDGAYWAPNDEIHNEQQDIAYQAWRVVLYNQLYLEPVQRPERNLDESFDFIHSREMFGSIADWDEYFRQCYLHLKPDGWLEALERGVKPVSDDGTIRPDHFWTTWGNTVLSVGETWDKGFNAWETPKEKIEAAGFVDVVQVSMKWPIGPWMEDKHMKELGMWNALRLDTGLEGYVMRLFTIAGGELRIWQKAFKRTLELMTYYCVKPVIYIGRSHINGTTWVHERN